jgi:hypothetical protein
MRHVLTRREFISSVPAAAALLSSAASGQSLRTEKAEDTLAIVSKYKAVFTQPPAKVPTVVSPDTPFLGNGDLLAAFAGDPNLVQFWVTTNDFWELRDWGGPRPMGRIVVQLRELEGATYHVEQDLATATLTASFTARDKTLTLTSWVAAEENLLVIEFDIEGGSMEGQISFRFPDELGLGVSKKIERNREGQSVYDQGGEPWATHLPVEERNWDDGLLTAQRIFPSGDQPTRLALAGRFIEQRGTDNDFLIEPGKKQIFFAAIRSWFKTSNPLQSARDRVLGIDRSELAALREQLREWWANYWNTSLVEIGEPSIERQYYVSHYNMGVLSRDPDFPPCDYGISTSDDPSSAGDYKLNYNYQAGFLGLNAAGRFQQTACYDAPGLAHLPRACADAREILGHDGAYMSLGLGPKGSVPEHIWLGQKSQNAFYLVDTAERWYLTRDLDYALKVYPMVREVANFWEADLRYEKDRYLVVDDSGQEGAVHHCINPSSGVAFVRMAMRLILDMSAALGVDAGKREKWRHIQDHVGPIPIKDGGTLRTYLGSSRLPSSAASLQDIFLPKGALEGKQVIVFEEVGYDWSFGCSVQTIPIYPAGEIGLDSEPGLLEAARNTVALRSEMDRVPPPGRGPAAGASRPRLRRGAWFDSNHGCIFFPASVRIGYDPEVIWTNLREWCEHHVWANGFRNDVGDGIENYSTVPNTIHEMMLLSHENVLRFFRVWPRKLVPNARFANLWAYGAFRVSAMLEGGEVSYVRVISEKGRDCTVENPWPGRLVRVVRTEHAPERMQGTRLTIKTSPGEKFELQRI